MYVLNAPGTSFEFRKEPINLSVQLPVQSQETLQYSICICGCKCVCVCECVLEGPSAKGKIMGCNGDEA